MSGAARLRVGIVGTGAIGQIMARAIDAGEIAAELVAVSDLDRERAAQFVATLAHPVPILTLEELVSRADLVVEAAGQAALPEVVPAAIAARKELLVMSVGGLLGRDDWFRQSRERGCRIHIPSGAIAGLDGLRAARRGGLDSVTLTSRKPVAALHGSQYVVEEGIDLSALTEETTIFSGNAQEACRAFPATSNVAATLQLAAGAAARVAVRVVAVPGGSRNIHEIEARGDFGRLTVTLENVPSENPRTSRLAALSAIATLDEIASLGVSPGKRSGVDARDHALSLS